MDRLHQMPNKQALWLRVMNQLRPNPCGSALICVGIFAWDQSAVPNALFQKLRLQYSSGVLHTNVHMLRA